MNDYTLLLALHIASVILLLGVGGGSAFYKYMADRSGKLEVILHTNKLVVLADWLFTTPAILLQPLTGWMLVSLSGLPLSTPWIYHSIVLYLFAVGLWLIAVWIQIRMKNLAKKAKETRIPLDKQYQTLMSAWIFLGMLSFTAMLFIFLLMFFKENFFLYTL
jgi:uncharacterized membrane protein